ncbi:hypothetical protein [Salinarimonas ramus]|uniref:Uncharacterized protein n=1 Tax=Salinarimonas ramus TaxID=690164 RepID=A0A917VAN5_9HYPH|nr:hypothetical protein [Salinarimonas ramus]GGK55837.1 hypothetical protein GCM10011322_48080 [Salinarimonas ramus]
MPNVVLGPPVSFEGWALLASAFIEEVVPGTTMSVMRATNALRHARFIVLGSLPRIPLIVAVRGNRPRARERLRSDISRVVPLLNLDDPAEIVRQMYGSTPEGFMALLNRLEPEPLPSPTEYADLFRAFEARDVRARVLMQMSGQIRASSVKAALTLDELSLHPSVVASIKDLDEAQRFNSAIALIRRTCSDVSDDEIRQSVLSRKAETKPREWLEAFLLRRMDRSVRQHPVVADDPVFAPLVTGPSLKAASQTMGNCLRQRVICAATSKAAYAVSRDHTIAIEMRPMGRGASWIVSEAVGMNNRPLTEAEERQCGQWFTERGLYFLAGPAKADAKLLDAFGIFDFEFPIAFEVAA